MNPMGSMGSWAQHTAQYYQRALGASGTQMNVAPGLNVGQNGPQLNVNDHLGLGVSNAANNQAMSGHYGSSAAHPWLFPSHGLNTAPHQTPSHDSSTFNANPFLHHPSYDSSFLSAQFQSKASYLPSAAVGSGFFNPMKKVENEMSNLRNAAYCQPMSGMSSMSAANSMTADTNNLTAGSLFPSHLAPTSWRHHPNLMSSNTSSGPFGILPHEAVNVVPSGSNAIGSGHSHSSHGSHGSHSSHSSHASHNSSHHSSSHNKSSNDSKGHHYHHKASSMSAMSSAVDNSFRNIMPSLPTTQARGHSAQSSLEANMGPKLTGHHHHSQADPYATNMFAMAAAMNSHNITPDYSMQSQTYARGLATQPTMNSFATNPVTRGGYPGVGFHSETNTRSRDLLGSSALLQSSKQGSTNSCNSRNMSANVNAMNAMNGAYLSTCAMMPTMNSQSVANYTSSPAHSVNNMATNQSASRSSSAASNHGLQQGNDSSCSFGYNSPATNLPQSPYPTPQRSNTANSSQGTPTASGAAVQSTQDFPTYGTSQCFPALGTQTPTPTPGYPTPPSSVGQPHGMSSSSQTSSTHEDQVSNYPQLTPQTPTQSAPFNNYPTNFNGAKLPSNGSQAVDPMLTSRSSCMVADAAISTGQSNSSVVPQRSPFLLPGASIHEPEPDSCGLSSMVVNPMSDNMTNSKIGPEPSLNLISQEIDFNPIANFPFSDDTNNSFNPNLKVEQNYNKKKNKSSKRSRKKDKNKNNNTNVGVSVGLSVDPNIPYSSFDYPNQQQYQNSYQNSNPYLMSQPMAHNQSQVTLQESHSTHDVMANETNGAAVDTHSTANACYEMQYQQHLAQPQPAPQQPQQQQQPPPQPAPPSQAPLPSQPEHELMQPLAPEPLPAVHPQEEQLIEPVMSLTQTSTASMPEKQSFPTIDDELSFLTEPTDCVSMETQTPNNVQMNASNVQMETQSPLVINQSSNICSERSAANLSPSATQNSNSNQGNSKSNQGSGFFNKFLDFISNSPNPTPVVTKEKKKKKLKESNENKVKQNNTINGQKSSKNSKKVKLENSFDFTDEVFDTKKNNFSAVNQNTLMSGENIGVKKTATGDRENCGESKFFKRRPSTNITTQNAQIIEMDPKKDNKNYKKRKQNKMDFNLFGSESQTAHDEYEFPDSPPSHSVKKSRKSSSSDNSNKKKSSLDFEKITSPSVNMNSKKTSNKKNNVNNNSKPLTTSSVESIENSINSVVMNTVKIETESDEDVTDSVLKNSQPELQSCSISPPINQTNKKPNAVPNHTNKKSPNIKMSPTIATPTTTMGSTVAIDHLMSPTQTSPISAISTNNSTTVMTTAVTTNSINSTSLINSGQQSVGMASAGTNTPRRRSQDKKASTIREGLMRTGDFVVSIDESQYDLPVIWRIEGKSLLQRFEPTEQEDITVYINTSSYSAWNPTVRQRYMGVDVRIMGCSRTRIVVEKLGLTQTNPNTVNGLMTIERNKSNASQSSNQENHNQENFEVFIQTLISQALDPNFISEIVKENDEYFLSHVQAIDDVCSRKKSRFFSKTKWDANIVKCVETYPQFTVTAQNNAGDLRCRLCHDNWSTQIMQFDGQPYNQMTLEGQSAVDLKQTKYAACDACAERIVLYSHLHHQKYNFFCKCKAKVENMRGGDESKESHVILELCLQDSDWINTLFKELEEIWLSCDKIR